MNKYILAAFALNSCLALSQSFAPAPGEPGSTAIFKDSSAIVSWAVGVEVERGFRDIADPSLGVASFGVPENALYEAEGDLTSVVSLGDGGIATLTFEYPIVNGNGPDFAVFENGFADHFMELGFVEVSSDGIHFVRFPAISEVPTDVQMGSFSFSDCRMVHNLAGKYRQGYGTPFDLEDVIDSAGIDVNAITHIRIIDVVGTIDSQHASFDMNGTIINDNYPTAFESGGFDLDGVAVLHHAPDAGIDAATAFVSISPNPTNDVVTIETTLPHTVQIIDAFGRTILSEDHNSHASSLPAETTKRTLSLKEYASSIVYLYIRTADGTAVHKIVIR